MKLTKTGKRLWLVSGFTLFAIVLSFFLGRYPEPYFTGITDLLENELVYRIVMDIRLPRIIMAFVLGTVLAVSGNVFQMIFRNPLVDAGFLGVSGGAAFGASLGIVVLGGNVWAIQSGAAFFALAGLGVTYTVAVRIRVGDWVLRLILAGIAVSAVFSAGTGALKYLADPLKELPDITFWLLGGLWGITWADTLQVVAVTFPCLFIIWLMRWRLNLLSMQDETVFSLTAAPEKERLLLLIVSVIATAAVVSKAGKIGWVGLIVPHIARRLVGSDSQKTIPCAMLTGGLFVLICDDISRSVLSGEIPLGILTSMVGAVLFIGLLMNNRFSMAKG